MVRVYDYNTGQFVFVSLMQIDTIFEPRDPTLFHELATQGRAVLKIDSKDVERIVNSLNRLCLVQERNNQK